MIDIDAVVKKLCNAGAQAVRRYADVSGEPPQTMPEYFMPAFVLNQLGDEITATLETGFGTLVERNENVRTRRSLSPRIQSEDLSTLARRYLDGRRPDMVLFEGEDEHKPKDQQDFLALVEFKNGWIDAQQIPGKISDRDKLLMMLAHVDTCPWGIACGWISKTHRDWQKDNSMPGTDDRWYECEIRLRKSAGESLFFSARLFARSSDNHRLQELVASTAS